MSITIAGIHTNIGKTICSAILCEALGYDYWKPVQAGDTDNTDSDFIRQHVKHLNCTIHPERYKLKTPMSPHHAAKIDGISIDKHSFHLPVTNNQLIVETAGGIMSPLADDFLNIDLMMQINLPVILVSNNYLGSINHTLLTIEALKNRKMNLLGIIFNGEEVSSSRSFILKQSKLPHLFSVPRFEKINHEVIRNFVDNHPINVL